MANRTLDRTEATRRVLALSVAKREALAARLGLLSERVTQASTRLVGFYVPSGSGADDPSELRTFLSDRLPPHMVPGELVVAPELPRGPTGKIDRAALLRWETQADDEAASGGLVTARNDTEKRLTLIWSDVLGQDPISVHDNFFEIGGHSLLAIRMLGKIRETFELDVPMDAIFEAPTIARLAEHLEVVRWALESHSEGGDRGEGVEEEIEL